jgi:uncharacterized protein (TIGR03437 family)
LVLDLALDGAGNLYVADRLRVRRITPTGLIQTVAGNGSSGIPVDGAVATQTSVSAGYLAAFPDGTLALATNRGAPIFRLGTDGIIRRWAGGGSILNTADTPIGTSISLDDVVGLAAGPGGSAFVTSTAGGRRVRRIDPSSAITTVAGGRGYGISGDGGDPLLATLSDIGQICASADGTIWFIDSLTVRRVRAGRIETVAGSHAANVLAGGNLANANLMQITAMAQDSAGNFYFTDRTSHSAYRANSTLTRVERIAGTGFPGTPRASGDALTTPLFWPVSIGVDAAGTVYIATDSYVYRLSGGQLSAVVGNFAASNRFRDNTPATSFDVSLNGMLVNPAGEILAFEPSRIFRVGADGIARLVTSSDTNFPGILGVAVGADGSVYFSELDHIKRVAPSGAVTIVAGGTAGFAGDGGPASGALFRSPGALAVDPAGSLWIADTLNHRIRRIADGRVSTVAGGGTGFGQQWEASSVELRLDDGIYRMPGGLLVDRQGYIWALTTNQVLRLSPAQIFPNWVVNGASLKMGPVSPGELIAFYGDRIGPPALTSATYVDGQLQRELAGTRVLFDGQPAPLIYVSETLSSAVVPYGVRQSTIMQVEYQGRRTNPITLEVAPATPGLFTYSGGTGPVVAVNQDFRLNSATAPAAPGEYLSVYLTGQGALTPAIADGELPTGPNYPAASGALSITVGGVAVPTSDIWNGLVYQGVLQVNFRIPDAAPAGVQPVVIRIGGAETQAGATIVLRARP